MPALRTSIFICSWTRKLGDQITYRHIGGFWGFSCNWRLFWSPIWGFPGVPHYHPLHILSSHYTPLHSITHELQRLGFGPNRRRGGVCGVFFCLQGLFFFSNPASSALHSLCLSFWVCGTPPKSPPLVLSGRFFVTILPLITHFAEKTLSLASLFCVFRLGYKLFGNCMGPSFHG